MSTLYLILLYLSAIVVANISVALLGPQIAPVNAFSLIALDLVLRDGLHDRWRGAHLVGRMFLLIAGGGVISWLLNPDAGQIALASSIAFAMAGFADALVYHALRNQSWKLRANGSNVAGAAVDSLLFPWLAFGGLDWRIVVAMFAAKVLGGAFWAWILDRTNLFDRAK